MASSNLQDASPPRGLGVVITPTAYGSFFIHDEVRGGVWDGETWRGFGEARRYATYREAFIARRQAVAQAEAA